MNERDNLCWKHFDKCKKCQYFYLNYCGDGIFNTRCSKWNGNLVVNCYQFELYD